METFTAGENDWNDDDGLMTKEAFMTLDERTAC